MRKIQLKRMMAGLLAAAFVAMSSMTALAADAVTVSGTGKYKESTDVKVTQDKDLFSNMKNLMPGDHVTNTVTVGNQSSRLVTLYMKAYPVFGSEDDILAKGGYQENSTASAEGKTFEETLLDMADMTLSLDGTVIYDGKASSVGTGLADAEKGICLGHFPSGTEKTLTIELSLPITLDNSYVNSFDVVDWIFYAEGTTPSDGGGGGSGGGGGGGGGGKSRPSSDPGVLIEDPEVPLGILPALGDLGVTGYLFGILVLLLIACGALYMRKRMSRS